MDVGDFLKQQQAALDLLQQQLAKPSEGGLAALLGTREQQAAAVKGRIDELGRQKVAAMQRWDAAIAAQQKLLDGLEGAAAKAGQVLQGAAPATPEKRGG